MKLRKHFRTSESTVDYIISDFSLNRIVDKDVYFRYCVSIRINKLSKRYDNKIDKILKFILYNCQFDNYPITSISKIILSLSKVTNVLTKGFISLIDK